MSNSPKQHADSPGVVILAGGQGQRLLPYTTSFPKPLMPVGDRPILEILLLQLARDGFCEITLAVGHLASLIEAYFGDGSSCGVRLSYLREQEPLGTAGPLCHLSSPPENLLVLNGDILTDLNFSDFYLDHLQQQTIATVATIKQEVPLEYGVLTTDDRGRLLTYEEKPRLPIEISGGVYAFSRRALDFIPANRRFDFPDLIQTLLDCGEPVGTCCHHGRWLDIGRRDDYEQASELFTSRRDLFLPSPKPATTQTPPPVIHPAIVVHQVARN